MFDKHIIPEDLTKIWNKTWPGDVQREKEALRKHIEALEEDIKKLQDNQSANLDIKIKMTDKMSEQLLEIKTLTERVAGLLDELQIAKNSGVGIVAEDPPKGEPLPLIPGIEPATDIELRNEVLRVAKEAPQDALPEVLEHHAPGPLGRPSEEPLEYPEALPENLTPAVPLEEAPAKTEDPVA